MSYATQQPAANGITAANGETYPGEVYHETTKAVGSQRWVANQWADGALPTHSCGGKRVVLRSSTGNFKGFQYTDGRGLLRHYAHIEAIRTRNGLIIGDTECFAKGFAHCSKPRCDHNLPLTTIQAELRSEPDSIYDIIEVDEAPNREEAVITFSSGGQLFAGEL